MKRILKILLILILFVGLSSFNIIKYSTLKGKLTEAQLNFIIENYNWDSEKLLIVNFRQPRSKCHYNNYINLEKASNWWTEFYSKMELNNAKTIFVYSDKVKAKTVIDSKYHFADFYQFFSYQFFSKDKTCYGLLIINRNGEYLKKAGEYMQKDIEEMIYQLE